jgi:hypothetical protein
MSLADYVATPMDRFELDDKSRGLGLSFPCNCCKHRHNKDTDVPCRTCDHNVNAVAPNANLHRTKMAGDNMEDSE